MKNKRKYIPVEMEKMIDEAVLDNVDELIDKAQKCLNNDTLFVSILEEKLKDIKNKLNEKLDKELNKTVNVDLTWVDEDFKFEEDEAYLKGLEDWFYDNVNGDK